MATTRSRPRWACRSRRRSGGCRGRSCGQAAVGCLTKMGNAWVLKLALPLAPKSCFFEQHRHGRPHRTAPRDSSQHNIVARSTIQGTFHRHKQRRFAMSPPILKSAGGPCSIKKQPKTCPKSLFRLNERAANGRKHHVKRRASFDVWWFVVICALLHARKHLLKSTCVK